MATREDLQAVIGTLNQTKETLLSASDAIIAKLNEANPPLDLEPEVAALGALNTAIADAATRLTNAVTPPAPVDPA